jgi:hypothetical protein
MIEPRRRTTCRVCGSTHLEFILSLGPSPLANAFLSSPAEFANERRYPLDLYLCEACALLQLVDVVDPEILFRHYIYVTGTSDTIAAHNVAYAQTIVELLNLGPGDLVAEVASNDGSLLQCFKQHGVRTLGIEPASNLAAHASAVGIETVNVFFNEAEARKLRAARGSAQAVVANNVLAHVDDPLDFLTGCRELVDAKGVISIEVPYVGDLLEKLEYDTVYHEHLCYFSIASLLRACDAVGLSAVRLDRVPVHGGSLRLYMRAGTDGHAPSVLALAAAERREGLTEISRYRQFADGVRANRTALVDLLERLSADGKRMVGYGAPAKGNTLLNYCGIDTRLLPYTVDKNALKVGLYTPGTHIPVRPVTALTESRDGMPDYVLILAWNFADEIMRQQQYYRNLGGRFILPIPEPRVV